MYTDLLILLPALIVFVVLLLRRKPQLQTPTQDEAPPPNAIVVDGSNVVHWSGQPSVKSLAAVLRDLEKKNLAPIVFFDASIGYQIGKRYYSEETLAPMIGLRYDRICVVSKGVVADEAILMFATDHNLRIVTNDRYRDWRVKFPIAGKKGRLVRGEVKGGKVLWHAKAGL